MDSGPAIHKILYVKDGEIEPLGPFETPEIALAAAQAAHRLGRFDAYKQSMYLLLPNCSLRPLTPYDIGLS